MKAIIFVLFRRLNAGIIALFFFLGMSNCLAGEWYNGIWYNDVLTNYINRPFLASGEQHGIMLRSDGTVWTWGCYFGKDSDGQLGQTIPADFTLVNPVGGTPARETNILGGIAVAAGDLFSMVLKWNGTVLSFGENSVGQLGLGNTSNTSKPSVITNLNSVMVIKAGSDFAMAVLSNGTVMAWGDNSVGQLGNGNKVNQHSPTNVLGLSNIVTVSCGYEHALALTTNGTVWAWGLGWQWRTR